MSVFTQTPCDPIDTHELDNLVCVNVSKFLPRDVIIRDMMHKYLLGKSSEREITLYKSTLVQVSGD